MDTKEEIYSNLVEILVTLFEVDRGSISIETSLYEDLDIDSIDAVDLIVELQQRTGKNIDPEEFKAVRSVNDVVNVIARLLEVK